MTRILIVDDHELILEALKSMLTNVSADIVCARSYAEAAAQLDGPAFRFCIVDYTLKPGTGDQLLEIIRDKMPDSKAICISGDFTAATLAKLRGAGFDGFYAKTDPLDEIIAAVESLDHDDLFYSSSVQMMLREASDIPRLSARQAELLAHLAAGRSNKAAAHLMGVESATVSFHMKHLKRKLGAENARDTLNRAKSFGLLPD